MWRAVATLIVVVVILYGSYLASKYIGKGLGKNTSSRYMRLVDQITVGQDRYIAIVQTSGKYLLIGITAGQIQLLSELKEEELFPLTPEETGTGAGTLDFKAMMEKLSDMGKKRR